MKAQKAKWKEMKAQKAKIAKSIGLPTAGNPCLRFD